MEEMKYSDKQLNNQQGKEHLSYQNKDGPSNIVKVLSMNYITNLIQL